MLLFQAELQIQKICFFFLFGHQILTPWLDVSLFTTPNARFRRVSLRSTPSRSCRARRPSVDPAPRGRPAPGSRPEIVHPRTIFCPGRRCGFDKRQPSWTMSGRSNDRHETKQSHCMLNGTNEWQGNQTFFSRATNSLMRRSASVSCFCAALDSGQKRGSGTLPLSHA